MNKMPKYTQRPSQNIGGASKMRMLALFLALALGLFTIRAHAQTINPQFCKDNISTGGDVTVITQDGTTYCVHNFIDLGTSIFEDLRVGGLGVDYLIDGGGLVGSGGGGAGGLLEGMVSVSTGITNVTVGAGGAGGGNIAGGPGKNGGSGGGGGLSNEVQDPGDGIAGLGNDGGIANGNDPPRGGGGAGEPGGNAGGTTGGDGVDGIASSITGTETFYAGGAGAGAVNVGGNGGSGIVVARYDGDPQTQPYLLISEILYKVKNGFSDQWIEIFNPTAEEINLSGYQLKNQGRGAKQLQLQIPSGYTIAPASYFVIAKSTDQSTFKSYYGIDADAYINWDGKDLNNKGEKIDLIDPNGQVVDYVAWRKDVPSGWGKSPNTRPNESLCRTRDFFYDTNTSNDWQVCENGGDPKVQPSDNFTWNGSASNAWNNGNNWQGGTAPGSTPNLDINIPATVNNPILSTALNISEITLGISDNAKLTVANGGSLTIGNNGIVSTGNNALLILNPVAEYINMSDSDPTLRIEQEITGNKGWRMISSPVITGFDNLLSGSFVTHGFVGSDYPDKQPNLIWWDETEAGTTLQGWRTAFDISDNTILGRGYFHYVFDGAGVAGSNDTYGDSLPLTLSVTGSEPNLEGSTYSYSNVSYTPRNTTSQSTAQDATYIDRIVADQGWNLIGNPTASFLDWDAGGWSKTNISETIYVWDPSANNGNGDYLVWNGSNGSLGSGKIAPMQSFWVQATANTPALSFNNSVKTSSATFRGKMAAPKQEASENPSIKFTLSGEGFKKDLWITFSDNGKMGIDKWDAFQLNPMAESWVAFYSAFPGEDNAAMTINHLPLNQTEDVTFLQLLTAIYSDHKSLEGECTLAWERSGEWPNNLNVYLQDDELQSKIRVEAVQDSISFYLRSQGLSYEQESVAYKSADEVSMIPTPPVSILYPSIMDTEAATGKMKSSSSKNNGLRFSVLISGDEMDEFLPLAPTLYQNYPNPFNPETTLRFSLPERSNVKLQVFDILGREVAQLANGSFEAGVHQVRWDARRMSSGIYLYRLIANGQTILIKKMTLLK